MWSLLLVLERLVLSSSFLIMGKVLPNCCDVRCGVDQGSQPMWSMNFFAFDVTTGWIFQSAEPAGIYSLQLYILDVWFWIGCILSCIFVSLSLVCKSISQTTDRGTCGDRPWQTLAHWTFCLRQGGLYYIFALYCICACAKVASSIFLLAPRWLVLYFRLRQGSL